MMDIEQLQKENVPYPIYSKIIGAGDFPASFNFVIPSGFGYHVKNILVRTNSFVIPKIKLRASSQINEFQNVEIPAPLFCQNATGQNYDGANFEALRGGGFIGVDWGIVLPKNTNIIVELYGEKDSVNDILVRGNLWQ